MAATEKEKIPLVFLGIPVSKRPQRLYDAAGVRAGDDFFYLFGCHVLQSLFVD